MQYTFALILLRHFPVLQIQLSRSGPQLVANLNFDFPQVVRQRTLGVAWYLVWDLFTIYSSFRWWKNFENRLNFDKVITISWVVHFFGTQCRWNSTGCRRRLCLRLLWPLTFWPNQYVSCANIPWYIYHRILVKSDEIFTKILYSPVFGLLPAVTLIFDLWSQKLISTSMNPNDQKIGWNSLHMAVRYGVHNTRSSGHCLLWPSRLIFWPNEYVPGPDTYHLIHNFGEISWNI